MSQDLGTSWQSLEDFCEVNQNTLTEFGSICISIRLLLYICKSHQGKTFLSGEQLKLIFGYCKEKTIYQFEIKCTVVHTEQKGVLPHGRNIPIAKYPFVGTAKEIHNGG